ncbi:MAG: hypothetical protein WCG10_00085 [Chlamydiota bacterium]
MASDPKLQVNLSQAPVPPTPVVTLTQRPACPIMMVGGRFIEVISSDGKFKALEKDQWNTIIPRIQAVIEASHLAADEQKSSSTSTLEKKDRYLDLTDAKITGFEIPLSTEGKQTITYHQTSTQRSMFKTTTKTHATEITLDHASLNGLKGTTDSLNPHLTKNNHLENLMQGYSKASTNESTQSESSKQHLRTLEQKYTTLLPHLDTLKSDPNTPLSDKALTTLLENLPSKIAVIPNPDLTNIAANIKNATSTEATAASVITVKIDRKYPHEDDSNALEVKEPLYLGIFIDPKTKGVFIYNPSGENDPSITSFIKELKSSNMPITMLNGHSPLDSSEVHKRQILLFANAMSSTPSNLEHQKKSLDQFSSKMKESLESKSYMETIRFTKKATDAALLQTQAHNLATKIEADIFRQMHRTKVLGYNPRPETTTELPLKSAEETYVPEGFRCDDDGVPFITPSEVPPNATDDSNDTDSDEEFFDADESLPGDGVI